MCTQAKVFTLSEMRLQFILGVPVRSRSGWGTWHCWADPGEPGAASASPGCVCIYQAVMENRLHTDRRKSVGIYKRAARENRIRTLGGDQIGRRLTSDAPGIDHLRRGGVCRAQTGRRRTGLENPTQQKEHSKPGYILVIYWL